MAAGPDILDRDVLWEGEPPGEPGSANPARPEPRPPIAPAAKNEGRPGGSPARGLTDGRTPNFRPATGQNARATKAYSGRGARQGGVPGAVVAEATMPAVAARCSTTARRRLDPRHHLDPGQHP